MEMDTGSIIWFIFMGYIKHSGMRNQLKIQDDHITVFEYLTAGKYLITGSVN
jgi:hypothetical protein